MGAILETVAPFTWEQPHMRDFWEVRVVSFTVELWIQNFRTTRSAFDKLCNAIVLFSGTCYTMPSAATVNTKSRNIILYKCRDFFFCNIWFGLMILFFFPAVSICRFQG